MYNPFRAEQDSGAANGLGHNSPSMNNERKDGVERTEGRGRALGVGGAGEGGGRLVLEEQHHGGLRGGRGPVDLRGGRGGGTGGPKNGGRTTSAQKNNTQQTPDSPKTSGKKYSMRPDPTPGDQGADFCLI